MVTKLPGDYNLDFEWSKIKTFDKVHNLHYIGYQYLHVHVLHFSRLFNNCKTLNTTKTLLKQNTVH